MHNLYAYIHQLRTEIEYDAQKAKHNLVKHGISFEEAATTLHDFFVLVREDKDSMLKIVGFWSGVATGEICWL